ncbi:MAG: DHH family phosphoesterase [Candidatus Nitrospinota bacterium M3_3B_026]
MSEAKEEKTPRAAADFLRRRGGRLLISTHVNPDGDGLGAVMALKWAVLKLGAEARIVIESAPPAMFDFFENYHWVETLGPETQNLEKFNAVITADSPTLERLGGAAALIADGAAILNIDHHVSNERFGAVNYIDESASSSAELVYLVIKELGLALEPSAAEYLYAGLITDTGRFRFSNTSPAALRAAAELVEAGARPERISERMYYNNTPETIGALGELLLSVELHLGGRVATCQFGLERVKSESWDRVETEGFVNYPLSIHGVDVAIMLREVEPGVTRASLRSKTDFDVNALANVFGGGGHAKAAGCSIDAPLQEARKALLEQAAARLG